MVKAAPLPYIKLAMVSLRYRLDHGIVENVNHRKEVHVCVASCVQVEMELLREQIRLDGHMSFVRSIYQRYDLET